jgi:hypothetical protein
MGATMPTTTADRESLRRARDDVTVFARVLCGEELWPHQEALARSTARIRAVCSGRRAGKTRTLAVEALHVAFRKPDARVLVVSAGEDSAKDLLAECSTLAASPLLAGSVLDDTATVLTLSNGSTIRAVPASEKRVRGKGSDLLVMDEAAYIAEDIWRAAMWTVLDRPGARILLSSTPRGRRDHFFARHFFMAKDGPVTEAGVTIEAFHWPSTVSPLVDEDLIEFWRRTEDPRIFAREVLAEWVDEAGQWFTSDELDANVAPFEMIRPGHAQGQLAIAGLDWGATHDASAIVVVGAVHQWGLNPDLPRDEPLYAVTWAQEHHGSMNKWAREVAVMADPRAGGYELRCIASESNGVGTGPTEVLQETLAERGLSRWRCQPVWTTAQRKQAGFGILKLLLQGNRLVLPADPLLRRQLEALEYETSEAGTVRIEVPATKGHDDVAMAACQAASCINHVSAGRPPLPSRYPPDDLVETPAGVRIPERPVLADYPRAFRYPRGREDAEKGW